MQAINSYNLLTMRLDHAIERLQGLGMLKEEFIQDLTEAAKLRKHIHALCCQIEADDFPEVRKQLRPLSSALISYYKVDPEEVKAWTKHPEELDQIFM